MKESQARALEELAKKHRVTLENALNSAEKDKNRLLNVSTYVHPIYLLFYLCGDDTQSITQWVPRSPAMLIKLRTLETLSSPSNTLLKMWGMAKMSPLC